MLMVVAILIPNKQVAVQFQLFYKGLQFNNLFYKGLQFNNLFYNGLQFNNGGTSNSYQFIQMLMVVAILITNKQVAIQFQTIL